MRESSRRVPIGPALDGWALQRMVLQLQLLGFEATPYRAGGSVSVNQIDAQVGGWDDGGAYSRVFVPIEQAQDAREAIEMIERRSAAEASPE